MDEHIPSTVILDKAKAEEMAYAEKPFREDAIALNGLINRAREQELMLVNDTPPSTDFESMTRYHVRNQDHYKRTLRLGSAKNLSLNIADASAENAKKRYEAEHPDSVQ